MTYTLTDIHDLIDEYLTLKFLYNAFKGVTVSYRINDRIIELSGLLTSIPGHVWPKNELNAVLHKDHVYVYVGEETNVGDEVVIEFIDGGSGFVCGKLERFQGEPECVIDGKDIDLAGEGFSSRMFRAVGKVSVLWLEESMIGKYKVDSPINL